MNFRILHYDSLNSTNDLTLQFAKDGAEEGVVVVSEFQKKGRGRYDRTWISPKGKGLLFSILLRPKLKASGAPILTHLAAQAVQEALVELYELPVKLKKPNDVLVREKKICGILTESSLINQKIEYVVLGVGINVTSTQKELLNSATSIYVETKKKVEKEPLLLDILQRFRAKYEELR